MVLGRIASNFVSERRAAKNENTPPKTRGIKAAVAQNLSSIAQASRRRRARLNGSLDKDRRRAVDNARKRERSRTQSPRVAGSVHASGPPYGAPVASSSQEVAPIAPMQVVEDCEMGDAPTPQHEETPIFKGITLPRRLARPPYREINKAALAAVDPELADVSTEYIRDGLEMEGLACVFSLSADLNVL